MSNQFSPQTIALVWLKGRTSLEYDERVYRADDYGNWMKFSDYGNRNSKFGWEIDHIIPDALGGSDAVLNLRPLHWRANTAKSDKLI